MGAYFGCIMVAIAIMIHGCQVKEAAEIQATAIREAAKSCRP